MGTSDYQLLTQPSDCKITTCRSYEMSAYKNVMKFPRRAVRWHGLRSNADVAPGRIYGLSKLLRFTSLSGVKPIFCSAGSISGFFMKFFQMAPER
jgi:hypothetical protein